MALGALVVLTVALSAPARAESVPASFDCAKAGRTVEELICSRAVLRWNDLALSRLYWVARDAATGAARASSIRPIRGAILDMATHGERRVAGTSQGDRPYAVSGDSGRIVWSTRNACGDEFMTGQDDGAPERLCLARMAKPQEHR